MEVKVTLKDTLAMVVVIGRLDTTNANQFEKEVQPLFEQKNVTVVVNCKEMTYISSSGLRVFMALFKAVKANSGTMTLENMVSDVKNVFDIVGFSSIFTIK